MNNLKNKIIASVNEDLISIENALVENLEAKSTLISKISKHILFSGGKRLRPLLMLLSAKLCGYDKIDIFKYSTIFEYLHAATLLHDDILDGSEFRRGSIVANHLWDCSSVLLTGDFLLARAISIATSTERCSIVKIVADTAEKMLNGEVYQLEKKKTSLTEEEYLDIISNKTAILFKNTCKIGAMLACNNKIKIDSLSNYGYHLGMAFQMIDDLLDYTNNSLYIGKKTGADLREGKLTIPVIFSINKATEVDKNKMNMILYNNAFSKSEFEWFSNKLKKYGGIEYTRQKALDHIKIAKKKIKIFDNNIISILYDIANYFLSRNM